jgi:dihydroorotase (multifunctional complex type)
MTVDLVIRNGTIYTAAGPFRAGIAVDDEKIVQISNEASLPAADRSIDASGRIIIPGLIETHAHFRDLETAYKEDYEHASKAAAAGGITMHVDMPNVKPPTTTVERFLEKKKNYAEGHVTVDFNMHPSASNLEEIPKLFDLGILAYKIFQWVDTKRDYPHMPEIGVTDLGHLMDIFKAVKKTGLPIIVHPHNQEIQNYVDKEVWQELGTDPMAYFEANVRYDSLSPLMGASNCIQMAEATGVRLHLTHMGSAKMINMVRQSKANGNTNLTCDSHPHFVFITKEVVQKLGPLALGLGHTPDMMEAIWRGWKDGTIDLITSEHAPHAQSEKTIGWKDMWKAPGGCGGQLQESLPMFLNWINKGMMSLETFIARSSLAPAKIFGLYPKKGVIQIGSDADLTIIDMKKKDVISNEKSYSKCGYSVYDGTEVRGIPTHTICRGTVVMEDGQIVVKPGYGKFQPRLNWKR